MIYILCAEAKIVGADQISRKIKSQFILEQKKVVAFLRRANSKISFTTGKKKASIFYL